ncbi:MAG TPA: hypothetical protein VLQ45_30550 [Thermoanaerobaculia bacterium]|nr:hypothetical protein [Thermoanaerobaculia bacterium]
MKGVDRPEAFILPENSMVPDRNLVSPAPDQFTHELIRSQLFYLHGALQGAQPIGEFPAGTKVVLMTHDGGDYCRVVDQRGLYVETEYAGLKKLQRGAEEPDPSLPLAED